MARCSRTPGTLVKMRGGHDSFVAHVTPEEVVSQINVVAGKVGHTGWIFIQPRDGSTETDKSLAVRHRDIVSLIEVPQHF